MSLSYAIGPGTPVVGLEGARVRRISALQRAELARIIAALPADAGQEEETRILAEIIMRCVTDYGGAPLFLSPDAAMALPWETFTAIVEIVYQVNPWLAGDALARAKKN